MGTNCQSKCMATSSDILRNMAIFERFINRLSCWCTVSKYSCEGNGYPAVFDDQSMPASTMSGYVQNGNDKQQQFNPPSKLRQKLIKSYRIKVLGMGAKKRRGGGGRLRRGMVRERESDARMYIRNRGHKIGHEYTTRRDESNLQAI